MSFDGWVPRPDCQHCEAAAAEIDRLRSEVDFWDRLHDEGFPDDPWTLGALHAEVERLREGDNDV